MSDTDQSRTLYHIRAQSYRHFESLRIVCSYSFTVWWKFEKFNHLLHFCGGWNYHAPRLRKQGRAKDARGICQAILDSAKGVLHPAHENILGVRIDAMNVSDALGDTHGAIEHCKAVLEAMELTAPRSLDQIANFAYHLGTSYTELAKCVD